MNGVSQSGNITPGHLAAWVANGVIGDGGSILASQKVLGSMFSANFNTMADQPILMPISVTAFQLTGIIVTNASVSLTAAQGGFYTAAAKGGSAVVSSGQAYSALTGKDLLLQPTLTAFAQTARFSADNLGQLLNANGQYSLAIYLSLSVAQGAVATTDVYILGIDLSPP
jgi:hypothetical protein